METITVVVAIANLLAIFSGIAHGYQGPCVGTSDRTTADPCPPTPPPDQPGYCSDVSFDPRLNGDAQIPEYMKDFLKSLNFREFTLLYAYDLGRIMLDCMDIPVGNRINTTESPSYYRRDSHIGYPSNHHQQVGMADIPVKPEPKISAPKTFVFNDMTVEAICLEPIGDDKFKGHALVNGNCMGATLKKKPCKAGQMEYMGLCFMGLIHDADCETRCPLDIV